MGISAHDLVEWCGHVDMRLIRSVCDIGDQDTSILDEGFHRDAIALVAEATRRDPSALIGIRKMRDFWAALGSNYVALDIAPTGAHVRRFDLNNQRVPWRLRGKFDLVTNCGTTEHVLNQLNAFRVIHDLTRPGGFIYHQLPIAGHKRHGLVNYNLKLFELLRAENGYDVLGSGFHASTDEEDDPGAATPASAVSLHQYRAKYRSPDACLRILFRKTHDGHFRVPLDL